MKPLNYCPKKGLAANIDDQWWRIESQTSYLKAVLLMRERVSFYKDDLRHREDGPAAVQSEGSEFWYLNGERHRTDGPAVMYKDGGEAWYLNGKLHRADGPAVTCADGGKYWYLKGKLIGHETP